MVGFCSETQRRVFAVLSAVLHIGNVEFQPKKSTYHHDESVTVKNTTVVTTIAQLLRVKEEILHQALISKRARASGETLVINYRMPEVKSRCLSSLLVPFFSVIPHFCFLLIFTKLCCFFLFKCVFFISKHSRQSQHGMLWPSAFTARCLTGSSCS